MPLTTSTALFLLQRCLNAASESHKLRRRLARDLQKHRETEQTVLEWQKQDCEAARKGGTEPQGDCLMFCETDPAHLTHPRVCRAFQTKKNRRSRRL